VGEMADFSIDASMDEMDHYERFKDADQATQYEEGLIDEYGATIGNPGSTPWTPAERGPCGEGKCPKCGGVTVERQGVYGMFYGCTAFPKCNGSRSE